MSKQRLDTLLIEKGFFNSRQIAQSFIIRGLILVNNKPIIKPGTFIPLDSNIEIIPTINYVSRGGLKLEKAIKEFNINVKDRICLDIGASTGGFTDCLLQHGAKLVYAIDVGYGQLSNKLREDSRVILLEETNVRYLTFEQLYKSSKNIADLCTIDVSFISILKILIPVYNLLNYPKDMICLIKPQFEVGPKYVKKGIVKSEEIHIKILNELKEQIENLGFNIIKIIESPIKGKKGNKEFFFYLRGK